MDWLNGLLATLGGAAGQMTTELERARAEELARQRYQNIELPESTSRIGLEGAQRGNFEASTAEALAQTGALNRVFKVVGPGGSVLDLPARSLDAFGRAGDISAANSPLDFSQPTGRYADVFGNLKATLLRNEGDLDVQKLRNKGEADRLRTEFELRGKDPSRYGIDRLSTLPVDQQVAIQLITKMMDNPNFMIQDYRPIVGSAMQMLRRFAPGLYPATMGPEMPTRFQAIAGELNGMDRETALAHLNTSLKGADPSEITSDDVRVLREIAMNRPRKANAPAYEGPWTQEPPNSNRAVRGGGGMMR